MSCSISDRQLLFLHIYKQAGLVWLGLFMRLSGKTFLRPAEPNKIEKVQFLSANVVTVMSCG
jgi:hypothetical protein